jgi:gliding motility-associated-like protein
MEICEGATVTLTASVFPTVAVDSYTYEWTSTSTTGIISTATSIDVTPSLTTTYTCTITDLGILQTANSESESFTIFVSQQMTIDTPVDVTADVSYTFPAITGTDLSNDVAYYTQPNGGGTQYLPNDTVNSTSFSSLPVTIYLYDNRGACSDETSFILDIITPPLFLDLVSTSDSICAGDEVRLTAQPDPTNAVGVYSYEWRIAGSSAILGTDAVLSVSPLTSTRYECTVTDSGLPTGLNQSTEAISVEVFATPSLNGLSDQVVESVFTFPVITGNNLSGNERYYLLADGQGSSFRGGDVLEFTENQNYPIEIFIYDSTMNGCEDQTSFLLTITTPLVELFKIPQFLTPNDDTYNDTWNVRVVNDEVIMDQIFIYDRYGKLLKQIFVTGGGWDGTFNDNPLPSSSYWYQFTYEYRGVLNEKKGYFALKR